MTNAEIDKALEEQKNALQRAIQETNTKKRQMKLYESIFMADIERYRKPLLLLEWQLSARLERELQMGLDKKRMREESADKILMDALKNTPGSPSREDLAHVEVKKAETKDRKPQRKMQGDFIRPNSSSEMSKNPPRTTKTNGSCLPAKHVADLIARMAELEAENEALKDSLVVGIDRKRSKKKI